MMVVFGVILLVLTLFFDYALMIKLQSRFENREIARIFKVYSGTYMLQFPCLAVVKSILTSIGEWIYLHNRAIYFIKQKDYECNGEAFVEYTGRRYIKDRDRDGEYTWLDISFSADFVEVLYECNQHAEKPFYFSPDGVLI